VSASDESMPLNALTLEQAAVLLAQAGGGSAQARDALLAALYPRLRRTAARMLREDAPQLTMRPTELLHEAALKLIRLDEMQWQDRAHFLSICCRVMRQVVVDRIRHVKAAKREHVKVTITHLADSLPAANIDADRLDELLTRLEAASPEHAQLVEMRFFAGMSIAEIAHVRGVSERTVKRQWQSARAWLLEALSD